MDGDGVARKVNAQARTVSKGVTSNVDLTPSYISLIRL